MKKRWIPFLLKLFIPGLLALPYLLNLPLDYFPDRHELEHMEDIPLLLPWLKSFAYAGLSFAILSPVFWIKKYSKDQKIGVTASWLSLLGSIYIIETIPNYTFAQTTFFNEGYYLLVIMAGNAFLIIHYFRWLRKREQHLLDKLHYLFHLSTQAIIFFNALLAAAEALFEVDPQDLFLINYLGFQKALLIISVTLIVSMSLTIISFYIGSVKHFAKPVNSSADLINEIGAS